MEVEKKSIVWLTAGEVKNAVRAYVRNSGQNISGVATITGLDELTEARHAVSIVVTHTNEDIK